MSSVASRVQPQDSRDEILKAAMRLFERRGFHETSMSEVAKEASVSKALIFWHFKTKEELFLAVLGRLLEPYYIDFAEEARVLDERAQLERLVESYLLFVRDNAPSVRFFIRRLMQSEDAADAFSGQIRMLYNGYQAMVVDLIRRAQDKGFCSRALKPESTASLLLSALNGFLIDLLFLRGSAFDLAGALEVLRAMLFVPHQSPGLASSGQPPAGVKENG